jgi:intraflagellar transport protein 74
MENEI